jgi:tRNA G18 (ribose-2'-O)-methylase SpoU
MEIAVLLHNIRSAHNVGAVFRTADAAGATHVYLSGYTPTPVDRFGRSQKDIAKTALGAQHSVPWSHHPHLATLLPRLKKEQWRIVGVEQDARAVDYRRAAYGGRAVLVLGNEVRGISPSLRDQCDMLVEIPMHGAKESLNVSVAAGIVLFRAIDQ